MTLFHWCRALLFACACVFAAAPPAGAEEQEEKNVLRTNADDCLARMPAGEAPEERPWRELVGRQVVVEGISWGKREKGYPEVLVGEARVRVEFHDEEREKAWEDGRLVRVEGHLTRMEWNVFPRRWGDALPEIYADEVVYGLEIDRWEFVAKVAFPGMRVLPLEPEDIKQLPGVDQDGWMLAAPADGVVANANTWRAAVDRRVVVEGTIRRRKGEAWLGLDAVAFDDGRILVVELPPRARKGWEEGRQVQIEGILVRFVVSPQREYGGTISRTGNEAMGVHYFLSASRWTPATKAEFPGLRLAPPRTKMLEPAVASRSPHDHPVVVLEGKNRVVKTWSEAVGCSVTMTGRTARPSDGRSYPGDGGPYLRIFQLGLPGLEIDAFPSGRGGQPGWNWRRPWMGRATGRLERHVALPGKAGRRAAPEGGPGTYYVLAVDHFEEVCDQNLTKEELEAARSVHDAYPQRAGEPQQAFQDGYPLQTPEGEKPTSRTWKDAVGRRVVVEGAAQLNPGKGYPHVSFHDDDFFPDAPVRSKYLNVRIPYAFARHCRDDAPVRIEGILHRYVVDEPPPPPPGAPRTLGVQNPDYGVNYYVQPTRVEFIPKLELPGMRLAAARPEEPQPATEENLDDLLVWSAAGEQPLLQSRREAAGRRVFLEGVAGSLNAQGEAAVEVAPDVYAKRKERIVLRLPEALRKGWKEGGVVQAEGTLRRFVVPAGKPGDAPPAAESERPGVRYVVDAIRWEFLPKEGEPKPGVRLAPAGR